MCAEAVNIDVLQRLCAIPDPKPLDSGLGPKPRRCPRRDEIARDEEHAAQLLAHPDKIDYASVLDFSRKSRLKPQVNYRKGYRRSGNCEKKTSGSPIPRLCSASELLTI